MSHKHFDRPVRIRLEPHGKVISVDSTRQAADLLISVDWPGPRDDWHRDAVDTCEKVMEGHRAPAEGHRAFEKVAKAAGLVVEQDGSGEKGSAEKMWFDRPVPIRLDKGAKREVRSVQGACEVLIDWPHARRGPFYQSAREKVEAALKGEITAAQAREAFLALCDHAGVVDT